MVGDCELGECYVESVVLFVWLSVLWENFVELV